jgi:cyclopropane fatty-acyl-phospholipid synthase-like methyltransferase
MDDVLAFSGFNALADIAFSVGLIEHFSPSDTKRAIQTHFDSVRSGGLVIVTFPTPTLLYRTTRRTIELLGQWKFHDERPLSFTEVLPTMERYGTILHTEINWPIFLTQGIVVARKK